MPDSGNRRGEDCSPNLTHPEFLDRFKKYLEFIKDSGPSCPPGFKLKFIEETFSIALPNAEVDTNLLYKALFFVSELQANRQEDEIRQNFTLHQLLAGMIAYLSGVAKRQMLQELFCFQVMVLSAARKYSVLKENDFVDFAMFFNTFITELFPSMWNDWKKSFEFIYLGVEVQNIPHLILISSFVLDWLFVSNLIPFRIHLDIEFI